AVNVGPRVGLLQLVLLQAAWEVGSGQLHYSVPEESKHGTFVGRIAQDLGLEVGELVSRRFRMVSSSTGGGGGGGGRRDYFEVNVQNGILFVNSRIDREELCAKSPVCAVHLEVLVEKPLRGFHVEVEIKDINDNAPVFSVNEQNLDIWESRSLGSRFPLEGASDADIGTNSLITYRLSPNDHLSLDTQGNHEKNKPPELVLKNSLDREESPVHHLLLTATDGGKPELTSTVQLVIAVLDTNDNAPVFNQSVYEVHLLENVANGTLVIKLEAIDLDDGVNKDLSYSFSNVVAPALKETFIIDQNTGEIRLKKKLDFEDVNLYETQVEAMDKGHPPMVGKCTLLVEILDVNDNPPEVSVTSLSVPVLEDAPPGTVVALISVSDKDSGDNGKVTCSISPRLPFKLLSTFKNYYSLVLEEAVDRERVSQYQLLITARDEGLPPLSATSSILVPIADVNDNAPAFPQPVYTVFVKENNPPGAPIFTVSAWDPDLQENAFVSYSVVERSVAEKPLSSYISVQSESGKLYALQPFDYEELKLLEFQVTAKDAGLPPLCGNVTVQVFILDENDNVPITSPLQLVPVSASTGHVVAKLRAVDADSGYNAWLRYELQEPRSPAVPFRVGRYSGEIRTTRPLDEADGRMQSLVIVVKDHGEPALSATATVSVSLVESAQAGQSDPQETGVSEGPMVDMNVSLIIAICSVSSLFLLVIILYIAMRCQPDTALMYSAGNHTLVCASEVGSWSYSQRNSRNLCVGEAAAAKNDLMVFTPNFPQSIENGAGETQLVPNLCGTVSDSSFFYCRKVVPSVNTCIRSFPSQFKSQKYMHQILPFPVQEFNTLSHSEMSVPSSPFPRKNTCRADRK
uniref:Cadherin domain-containing protein n=1 Tax=Sphenodon punctatus TaxID=8508 RepID=A0A8D0HMS9_SPHPU